MFFRIVSNKSANFCTAYHLQIKKAVAANGKQRLGTTEL